MASKNRIHTAWKTIIFKLAALALLNASHAQAGDAQSVVPKIDGHGRVTSFPNAKAQPRDSSRIVVDLTIGGPRNDINPGVEKLARFVNIYAAGGKSPARAEIAVVLHGDATEVALSDAAYAMAFDTTSNPNLPLIRKLTEAGVELFVCGQSLTHKGHKPDQTAAEVEVAVSALTALVNHQQDGFAYVPLK